MRVGIIAPIAMLDKYCVTKTQYCLPRLIVENTTYRDFYQKKTKEGKVVIMDLKKPSWKREPEDWEIVEQALKVIEPEVIILPSYTFEKDKTVKVTLQYSRALRNKNYQVWPCLEGTSKEEVRACQRSLKDVNEGLWFALPSYLYSVAEHKGKTMMYIENHMSMGELDGCGNAILVTSLPIRLGLEGRLITDYRPSPSSLTFMETEDRFPKVTERNVRTLIDYYEIP